MGGNISNKPPANSLPSECPVARKGKFHRTKKGSLQCCLLQKPMCHSWAQTETPGNYPAAHHLRHQQWYMFESVLHSGQFTCRSRQSLPANRGLPGSPAVHPESSRPKGVYTVGHSHNVKAPDGSRIARRACVSRVQGGPYRIASRPFDCVLSCSRLEDFSEADGAFTI